MTEGAYAHWEDFGRDDEGGGGVGAEDEKHCVRCWALVAWGAEDWVSDRYRDIKTSRLCPGVCSRLH